MSDEISTATATETPAASSPATTATLPASEIEAARALILGTRPNVIPEMLSGSTIAELSASADAAEAVYQRIADNAIKAAGGSAAAPPATAAQTPPAEAVAVPSGTTSVVALDQIPTAELIKRGLAARRAAAKT